MSFDTNRTQAKRQYYAEIFLICFAGLLLEISYTRIFSFKFFYFFTYLVIGVALLGLGAAGVAVALVPAIRRVPLDRLVSFAGFLGSLAIAAGYLVIARTPIDTFAIPTTYSEPAKLALVCGALFAAFFAMGVAVASILGRNPGFVNRLYFADLIGAALGCAVAIPLISSVGPVTSVMISACAFALAGFRVAWRQRQMVAAGACAVLTLGILGTTMSDKLPGIVVDKSKHLRLGSPGAPPIEFTEWGPFFRIDVGNVPAAVSHLKMVFHDGLMGSTLQEFNGDFSTLTRFDTDSRRLPFALGKPDPKELIIGAAGGHEILAGLYFGAGSITGVEINPVTYSLVKKTFADYIGHLDKFPNVNYVNDEGRSYLARSNERFDIINFVSPDSYSATNAATASAFVLCESYLYTVEAVIDCMNHLTDDGIICMELGEIDYDVRPTRTTSYLSTAREALHRLGMEDFEKHVILIRSPGLNPTSTIILKKSPFAEKDLDAIFASSSEVTDAKVAHAWGRTSGSDPAHQIISMPYDQLAAWYASYRYDVGPVFDDAPFFWHFARFADVYEAMNYESQLLVEADFEYAAGERVLLFTLKLCTIVAAIVLLLPFALLHKTWRALPRKGGSLLYFAMLGLGFMAIEISLIQKLTLLLGYPTYALTITLMSMLTFAGIGSLLSGRYGRNMRRTTQVLLVTIGISILFYQLGLPQLTAIAIAWPLAARTALCMAVLAPIGISLGAFMPLGLRAVASLTEHKNEYIAWCWAVNGFFSVIGSTLTTILSMAYGFTFVLYMALGLYTVAVLALLFLSRGGQAAPAA